MRDRGSEDPRSAQAEGWALGALSTYNLEFTQGIVRAAEEADSPVILAAQALLAADLARTRVGIHLDHSRDLTQIQACLAAGYSSVMVDGSHLPFEDIVTLTSSAVAVGNVHGTASGALVLDTDLLASMHAVVPAPLGLHGASGLPDAELAAVRRRGVAKVNVNTELRAAFLQAMSQALSDVTASADVARALQWARDAVRSVVLDKIRALSTPVVATSRSARGP